MMEIKIIADKKLLEAFDKLAEALKNLEQKRPAAAPQIDPVTALPAVVEETVTPPQTASEEPSSPAQDAPGAPTREEVQRIAVTKIQSKLGAKVKALIEKHGGTRVSDVPEANLAAFKADLEALA